MNLEQWLGFYNEILNDFSFSIEKDMRSALCLNNFLKRPDLKRLEDAIRGRKINIYGAGPSIEKLSIIPTGINIAADGVCSFLLERGIVPEIVVTDLDGRIEDIQHADRKGALIIVHAHGDNADRIEKFARTFINLFGTTQTRPFGCLLNFGGFTDGDRAGYIAEHFMPSQIHFYGMDFEAEPGRYSFTKPEDLRVKKKKLKWAKQLVEYLKENSDVSITLH